MSKYLYGCDPEFFATIKRDGKNYAISPAMLEKFSGIKPVQKDIKHPVYIARKGEYSWMQDGVAFELTIKPEENPAVLYQNIQRALGDLQEYFSKITFDGEGIELYSRPVVNIAPEIYLPFLNDDKIYQGFIFGCDPDEDAIVPDYVCETQDVRSHPYRYGGGHMHFSGPEILDDEMLTRVMVRFLAVLVGNYFMANSPYPEEEVLRARTYGKPGRFRWQHYSSGIHGVEYRTPSNSWIGLPEEKVCEMYERMVRASELIKKEDISVLEYLNDTVKAIITGDVELSKKIVAAVK